MFLPELLLHMQTFHWDQLRRSKLPQFLHSYFQPSEQRLFLFDKKGKDPTVWRNEDLELYSSSSSIFPRRPQTRLTILQTSINVFQKSSSNFFRKWAQVGSACRSASRLIVLLLVTMESYKICSVVAPGDNLRNHRPLRNFWFQALQKRIIGCLATTTRVVVGEFSSFADILPFWNLKTHKNFTRMIKLPAEKSISCLSPIMILIFIPKVVRILFRMIMAPPPKSNSTWSRFIRSTN